MVLTELGTQLTCALQKLQASAVADDSAIEECLKEVMRALILADINISYLKDIKSNIKKNIEKNIDLYGNNKKRLVQQYVVEELINLLEGKKESYVPKKGSRNVILFVGLQGSGKTTTCTKFAHYYQKKGFKTALVCADTFRAGAFDQLKQNAAKVKIPFYGSYSEVDPVKIASDGVNAFLKEKYDLIIVDSSGRHKQESELFEEMKQVESSIRPEEIVFVIDSHIGQSCHDQAMAFKNSVTLGSIIITKIDGHAKGGGALSAVASTGCPITFIGTGEHINDFENFEAKSFVSRLLGLGDINGLVSTLKEVIDIEKQPQLINRLSKGKFVLRDMYDQFQNVFKMGSLSKVMSMIPGFGNNLISKGTEKEGIEKIKKFMVIMDSMTNEELDCVKPLNDSRCLRICKGSGTRLQDIRELLEQFKFLKNMVSKMGKLGLRENNLNSLMRNQKHFLSKMNNFIDPSMLGQMGGPNNMVNILKEFTKMDDLGGSMANMMKQMGFKK
ncbi:signal recognition particle subunit SRP54, putative [Plasmodium vivax]|uniref:Signal recognition particle 54 kDa protein n=6 Tax=Plasmodium vivax TaxID=5855 RepID=A5K3Q7_PLAVS|nr:signal recognition particle 54 kDa protein, putative [Plasmodium vivax]KMZ78859.1 signal recognition particle protein [Plasmodium vivax India VII]KMZ85244.1 signal recognition particle protein [Plasmodium vivax Brazil I]KMZ91706.1 signal recognition particle protein [Plasmodium vivax Mauritania I]KMZ97917.1 signal recognition particle protein [Plasmodium vivax North Korean]EDL46161.1 signal recognition particle 54 kDa protein, putative [Plasmodium vivax]|eukprot:XP_001615888.1 signal recognition particle 54 kDa protein [Plasmodium vivax Sal-1]